MTAQASKNAIDCFIDLLPNRARIVGACAPARRSDHITPAVEASMPVGRKHGDLRHGALHMVDKYFGKGSQGISLTAQAT